MIDGQDPTSFLKNAIAQSPYSVYYNGNPNYNNTSFNRTIPPYTVYLTWVWGGSYSVSVDFENGPSITSIVSDLVGGVIKDLLSKREAKQISIMWDALQQDHSVTVHIEGAGLAGICGSNVYTKNINRVDAPYWHI